MRTKLAVLVAGLALAWLVVPVAAHHAVGAEYDESKPVTLTGTVTKVEWTNPHSRLYLDVKEADGTVVNWNLELTARSALVRQGWTSRSVAIGETLTVEGHLARSGVKMINAQTIKNADGNEVLRGVNE
jgi:hypothetical protein